MSNHEKTFGDVTLDGVLANRVNHEPLIFRGLTSSELNVLFLGAAVFWLPVCLLLGFLTFGATTGIGASFALTIVTIFFGASVFQRIKRNRPDGYYTHKIAITLERIKLKRSGFDLPNGALSLGRSANFQSIRRSS